MVGNWVFSGAALPSAAASALASAMLIDMVALAACASDTPLFSVNRCVSAFSRACDAAELLKPASCSDWPGAIASICVLTPDPSSVLPATETNVGNLEELILCAAT